MSKPNEYSGMEKLAIIQEYQDGFGTLKGITKKYNISKFTFKKWRRRFELYGLEGLEIRTKNQSYSDILKLQAVTDYLSGHLSQDAIVEKYHIASRTQLQRWIQKYNGHSELKSYHGGTIAMMKGRKTTFQERLDIVNFCMAHQRDYLKTMEQFQVSYQQVYQWVKKLEQGGAEALHDRRGRKKV
jgi:transposase